MKTRLVLLCFAALAAPASAASAEPVKRALAPPPAQWVPGELVVQFESDVTAVDKRAVHLERGADVKKRVRSFRVDVVELPRGLSVLEAVAAYRRDPAVALAEPNYIRYATDVPDDEFFGELWALENDGSPHHVTGSSTRASGTAGADIDAPSAWDGVLVEPLARPIVAVIDAGFDVSHPDLAPSLWTNVAERATEGDDDLNGYTNDVHGWDFGNDDATLASRNKASTRHGTHVAGTIAAAWGNGTGIAGVCRWCRVMLLRSRTETGR